MKMVHALILDINCGTPNCPDYVYQIRETDLITTEFLIIDESDVFKDKDECQKACEKARPKYVAAYERILKDLNPDTQIEKEFLQWVFGFMGCN